MTEVLLIVAVVVIVFLFLKLRAVQQPTNGPLIEESDEQSNASIILASS